MNVIPTPARFFGLAGLLPFFFGALLCWVGNPKSVAAFGLNGPFLLSTYGAVILSFLGGIRWGVAMQTNTMMHEWPVVAWAMVPSLVGWFALLMPALIGLPLLGLGFVLQLRIDAQSTRNGLTPAWFLTLRLILTSGALLSLAAGWFGVSVFQ